MQNNFETDPVASKELTLFRQGGSKVIKGNLVTLPLGGGLLYEEPIYIEAAGGASAGSYPTLKRVFVFYNGQVGYGTPLQGALAQVFTGLPSAGQGPPSGSGGGRSARPSAGTSQQAEQDLRDGAGRAARRQPGRLRQAIASMKQALDKARQAAGTGSGAAAKGAPSPSPTPAGTATAGPSPSR